MLLQTYYTNPLMPGDFPDPSVIAVKNEGFFAFATHDDFSPTINNILVSHSWDMVHWEIVKGALAMPPAWAKTCHRFWCPDVSKMGDEYRLYYAAEPDTKDGMCLAMAFSKTLNCFEDIGKPLAQLAGSTYEMIDPCLFTDPKSGKHYLYYGSAHQPIKVVEVARDGKTFLSQPVAVLHPDETQRWERLREGAYVTYNKNYDRYFMWVSGNNTWAENDYAVSVYWSSNPLSGFEKIPGEHHILQPNKKWDAAGQNCIITDAVGNEWMIYHAVDANEKYIKGTDRFLRKMCMDRIIYNEGGWPVIKNHSPSYTQQSGPVVDVPEAIAAQLKWQPYQ